MAKAIRKANKKAHITVLEKRDFFMSCPLSNAYLGGLKEVDLNVLCRDFYLAAKLHDYVFMHCEVTGFDRTQKKVFTTKGEVDYDYLVLSPGIGYDYKKQFPTWSEAKIRRLSQEAPAGLITGNEHVALKRELMEMEEGNVIITIPEGKFRCLTAPYERAAMIASYMNKAFIKGKVIVLDHSPKPRAKASAYMEAYDMLYRERIEYYNNVQVTDVDLDKKTVHVDGRELSYAVLNFIPPNRAHPLVEHSGISVNAWGGAKLSGAGFTSIDDAYVYVVGDAVGHDVPAMAQMANWAGRRAGQQIADRIAGMKVDLNATKLHERIGESYSMVSDLPEEAIMEDYEVLFEKRSMHTRTRLLKHQGAYRSDIFAQSGRKWFKGIMEDTFGV